MTPLSSPMPTSGRISADRFNAILFETTPLAKHLGVRVEHIGFREASARLAFTKAALRSGGTYSGPSLMALIDVTMYAAVLGVIGEDPRPLTTNIAIDFLRRAPARDLLARCRLLSHHADFAVGSIIVHPEGDETETVCASTCTYALPSPGQAK